MKYDLAPDMIEYRVTSSERDTRGAGERLVPGHPNIIGERYGENPNNLMLCAIATIDSLTC